MTKFIVNTNKMLSSSENLIRLSSLYDEKIRDFYYYINKLEWEGKDAEAFQELAKSYQKFIEKTGNNMLELGKTLETAAIKLENTNRKVVTRNGGN